MLADVRLMLMNDPSVPHDLMRHELVFSSSFSIM